MNSALLSSNSSVNVYAASLILYTGFEFINQRVHSVDVQNETARDLRYETLLHLLQEYDRLRRKLDEQNSRYLEH